MSGICTGGSITYVLMTYEWHTYRVLHDLNRSRILLHDCNTVVFWLVVWSVRFAPSLVATLSLWTPHQSDYTRPSCSQNPGISALSWVPEYDYETWGEGSGLWWFYKVWAQYIWREKLWTFSLLSESCLVGPGCHAGAAYSNPDLTKVVS